MINNLSPGFLPNGQIDTANIETGKKVPPSSLRTIGDALNKNGISWAYYGGGYNAAVRVANGSTDPVDRLSTINYRDICTRSRTPPRRATLPNGQRISKMRPTFSPSLTEAIYRRSPTSSRTASPTATRRSSTLDLFEAMHGEHRRQAEGPSRSIQRNGALRYLRRGRRLLGFGLHPAGRLLRDGHPHPAACGLALPHAAAKSSHEVQ